MTNRQNCPQCGDFIQSNAKRVVRDSCGHEKCRVCLLLEVEGCRKCREENGISKKDFTSLLSEEANNAPTVITNFQSHELEENISVTSQEDTENLQKELIERSYFSSSQDCQKTKPISKSDEKPSRKISSKRTYNKTSMPNNIIVEGEPPLFKCIVCNSKFRTKHHVKYHEFCLSDSKPYSCNVCFKMFTVKAQLRIHQLLHSERKLHICRICDKAFRESGKLKRHMILHSDKKPFVCDECGKQFKTSGSLKLHGITHTDEKPYGCEYCEMKFNNSSNLKKHVSLHSDQRAHMCERCGKKFKQKLALNVHRRSHFHRREFSCEKCGKAFVNNKDLKRHELVHTDTNLYACGFCSVSFRRKDNLRRHIRNTHPNEKAETCAKVGEWSQGIGKVVVDNPNAINVITASPIARKNEYSCSEIPTPRTCINGPLKLAFKTSAFRRNYNINRDFTFDSNLEGLNVEDHETPSLSRNLRTKCNSAARVFSGCFSDSNLLVDEFYANGPHVIKNIKFKIPDDCPPRERGSLKQIISPPSVHIHEESGNQNRMNPIVRTNVEINNENLKIAPVAVTSVIVNTSSQKNIHWRRRISQTHNN